MEKQKKTLFEQFKEKNPKLFEKIAPSCPHYNLVVGLNAVVLKSKDLGFSEEWNKETKEKIDSSTIKAKEELVAANELIKKWYNDYVKQVMLFIEEQKLIESNKDENAITVDMNELTQLKEFNAKCENIATKLRLWSNKTQIGMDYEVLFDTINDLLFN